MRFNKKQLIAPATIRAEQLWLYERDGEGTCVTRQKMFVGEMQ